MADTGGTQALRPPPDAVHRNSALYLAGLLASALVAFWPSYFNPPKRETLVILHVHGIAMFLWLALLVTQASLIRFGRRPLHRRLGRLSYGLVPVIFLATLSLENVRLRQKIDAEALYFLWVILSLLAVFTASYLLAMRNRHRPAIHARYMVCTALALVDPIFARILFFGLGVTPPLMQVATFAMIDALLVALAWMDWRRGDRIRVFPAMLAVFAATQVPTFFLSQAAFWGEFARWYAALPLSWGH